MAKKLFLYFTNEDGQPTTIQIQAPRQDLTSVEVRAFMQAVIDMKLFRHKGQMKYAAIKGAKYVDKKTEVLL